MNDTIDEIKSLLDDLETEMKYFEMQQKEFEKQVEAYLIRPQNRVEEIFLEEVKQKLEDYRNGRIKL